MAKYVLALDQGTTSSRAILFNKDGTHPRDGQQEFPQIYPSPGHVEHDPEAIWDIAAGDGARRRWPKAGIAPDDVAAIGITNQRETTVVWDKATGKPVANAIVWQSRITAADLRALKAQGLEDAGPREDRAGRSMPTSPARRSRYILDNVPGARETRRARRGAVRHHRHVPDLAADRRQACTSPTTATPAARCSSTSTRCDWDDELLAQLGVPRAMLPGSAPRRARSTARPTRRVLRRADPDRRRRRRPAGGDLRPGLLRARHGEEHLRHRLLHAASTPATTAVPSQNGLLTTIALAARRQGRLRARRSRLHRRRGRAVAARRAARDHGSADVEKLAGEGVRHRAASTWCRPSSAWARRTGTSTRAARSSA